MKDRFSSGSGDYARFRLSYPEELVQLILSRSEPNALVWDAGTGNGQLAGKLAPHVAEILASDISYEQIKHAPQIANVTYHILPSESTHFGTEQFDLVTVAQALHWFDLDQFYAEVARVLKKNGVFAAAGYGLCRIAGMNELLDDFYQNEIGKYWDEERKMVEEGYLNIPFPFDREEYHQYDYHHFWSFEDFLGYLGTWSAVKRYTHEHGVSPMQKWHPLFSNYWGREERKEIITPIFLRMGRKP